MKYYYPTSFVAVIATRVLFMANETSLPQESIEEALLSVWRACLLIKLAEASACTCSKSVFSDHFSMATCMHQELFVQSSTLLN